MELQKIENALGIVVKWIVRAPLIILALVVLYYLGDIFAWLAAVVFK